VRESTSVTGKRGPARARDALCSCASFPSARLPPAIEREVRNAEEIARGLKTLDEADALLGIPGGVTSGHHETMIAAANSKRLPSVFYTRTRSTRDAVLAYGASDIDVARQAARLLDKILKGANSSRATSCAMPWSRPISTMLSPSSRGSANF
jgi:hypothetical protein